MVAQEPTRERRWGLLALAQYQAGRQAEALAHPAAGPHHPGQRVRARPRPPARRARGSHPASGPRPRGRGRIARGGGRLPLPRAGRLRRRRRPGLLRPRSRRHGVPGPARRDRCAGGGGTVGQRQVLPGPRGGGSGPGARREPGPDRHARIPSRGRRWLWRRWAPGRCSSSTSARRPSRSPRPLRSGRRSSPVWSTSPLAAAWSSRCAPTASASWLAHPAFARLVENGLYLLGAMGPAQLRSAIEGPAAQAGLRLEPGWWTCSCARPKARQGRCRSCRTCCVRPGGAARGTP